MKGLWIIIMIMILAGCTQEDSVSYREEPRKERKKRNMEGEAAQEDTASAAEESFEAREILNPFLTSEEQERFRAMSFREPLEMDLSAIFHSSGKSRALIEGRIYTIGDTIGTKTITGITPTEVILKEGDVEYVVQLKGVYGPKK